MLFFKIRQCMLRFLKISLRRTNRMVNSCTAAEEERAKAKMLAEER